jgi:hypothetical protein
MYGFCSAHGSDDKFILVGKPEGRRHLGDLGVDGRILLKSALNK